MTDFVERPPRVICVLGCPSPSAALQRRAEAGAAAYFSRGAQLALATGGRAWDGIVEADEIARRMIQQGVPEGSIVRERCSFDTVDNARFTAALLRRRGLSSIVLVTCSWHVARSARLFRSVGLDVEELGVEPPHSTLRQRVYWHARETLASWRDMCRNNRIV